MFVEGLSTTPSAESEDHIWVNTSKDASHDAQLAEGLGHEDHGVQIGFLSEFLKDGSASGQRERLNQLLEREEQRWAVDTSVEAAHLQAPFLKCAHRAAESIAALMEHNLLSITMQVVFESHDQDAEGALAITIHGDGYLVKLQQCSTQHTEHTKHAEECKELSTQAAQGDVLTPQAEEVPESHGVKHAAMVNQSLSTHADDCTLDSCKEWVSRRVKVMGLIEGANGSQEQGDG